MASPPPSRSSITTHAGEAVEDVTERVRFHLEPPPAAGNTSAPSSHPASIPPNQSTTPDPSTATQSSLNSHSNTDAGPSNTVTPRVSAKHGTTSGLGQTMASRLASALQALRISTAQIPPLKPVVDKLADCLGVVQGDAASVKEYAVLISTLTSVACSLNEKLDKLGLEASDSNTSCERVASSIQAVVEHITNLRNRSEAKRTVNAVDDKDETLQRYRNIKELFQQLQKNISLQVLGDGSRQPMMILFKRMSPAKDARYNSGYSTTIERRGCNQETREQVQADLQSWVQDPSGAKVYWMNGIAGTGKTAIAYSLCEWLTVNQQLGASFFCSRASPSCRNVSSIVPTIAYDLARYSTSFQKALRKILEQDPGTSKLNIVQQFERLIRDPLLAAESPLPAGVVIVIDALDECDGGIGVSLILQVLLRLSTHLPLKFFVTSRPEPAIQNRMLSPSGYPSTILHLHDIEQWIVDRDIKKYLAEELKPMSPAPTDRQIEQLAKLARNLFIYAATVVRYILPRTAAVDSAARLEAILKASQQVETNEVRLDKKYQKLDELYTTILAAAKGEETPEEEIQPIRFLLWTTVCAKEPMTIRTLSAFLSSTEAQVLSALKPLRSLLHVSERGGLVSTFHVSLPDYIHDYSRSVQFWCDKATWEISMVKQCFALMKTRLCFNICKLASSLVLDKDIKDLQERFNRRISPTLLYACLYWGDHLSYGGASESLCDMLVDFMTHQLLFWMEVLNIGQRIAKGVSQLSQAEKWLRETAGASNNVCQLAFDASDFVSRFAGGACSQSTPHIYISALPFCSKSRSVYANYYGRMRQLMDLKGTIKAHSSVTVQATWATNHQVKSLGFSSDGARLVVGDDKGAIQVRNAQSGETTAVSFQGHASSINSISFSPDGTRITSGSEDRTVQVWDAYLGDSIAGPLHGHTLSVRSVTFSPDGKRVASGSLDRTTRVWDAYTGDCVAGPFHGHTSSVNSVAYSPNGTCIISGSSDRTIGVWDANKGEALVGPLHGHTSSVNSVAFSPTGAHIISGSQDKTIRMWNALTGDCLAVPFQGHTYAITFVSFSPDGVRVVSASQDKTVRIWDTSVSETRVEAAAFQGHTSQVNSVVFSPDGTRIVSSSYDCTIRVWDARPAKATVTPIDEHTASINAVAFSHDGQRIASDSEDLTIRVWDSRTGDPVAGPFRGHTGSVESLAFSPDGNSIASGSSDRTVRVWNASSGNIVAKPSYEHTSSVSVIAFLPDGMRVAFGSQDGTIRVLDVCADCVTTTLPPAYKGLQKPHCTLNGLSFSPDGSGVVSGFENGSARVWDARTGDRMLRSSRYRRGLANSITLSNQPSVVPSSSDWRMDITAMVWGAHTGDIHAGAFREHKNWVKSIAFSPDGRRAVSGSSDRVIRVWDISDPKFNSPGYLGPPVTRSITQDMNQPDGVKKPQSPPKVEEEDLDSACLRLQPQEDGWFVDADRKRPVFWVPPDLRSHIPHSHNTLAIGPGIFILTTRIYYWA